MSSLEKERPGINPRFFNQKMAQNEPEKKIPSTAAKATSLAAKESWESIHFIAHSAFLPTMGTVSIALKREAFSAGSLTYVSIKREYVSL